MVSLDQIVKESVFEYAGGGDNILMFPVANEEQKVYSVLIVDAPVHKIDAEIVVMARLADDKVIIEEDTTDYPLLEVLMKRGVPRDKIIRAYAGENL